jgi:hypothetical protein
MLGESDEFRHLRHAVEKAAGDRARDQERLPPVRRENGRHAAGRGPGGDVGASWPARLRVPRDRTRDSVRERGEASIRRAGLPSLQDISFQAPELSRTPTVPTAVALRADKGRHLLRRSTLFRGT